MSRTFFRIGFGAAAFVLAVLMAASASARQGAAQPSAREQAAVALLQASDWAKANSAFEELTKAEAANPRAWFGLGVARHGLGQFDGAIAALGKAKELGYQPAAQLTFRLARSYARKGDKEQALVSLEGLVKAGFVNVAALQVADLDTLRDDARFKAVVDGVNRNAKPCESDPRAREFDFWIGEWDVQQTGQPRAPQGATSIIERSLDGCAIIENWMPQAGPTGKSLNAFNRVTKEWEQFWVDSSGQITHFKGVFHDDGNLYYEAYDLANGLKVRMTFFKQGPNQVRQFGQQSADGGRTWTVRYDLTYIRKNPKDVK
jgi:tetratricopeptide (TPR) repeat protein